MTVHVIAKWYQQVPGQPLQSKLDVDDSRPYELKDVISIIVNLEYRYDENTKAYSIAEDVRETLDVAVRSLRRLNVAGASAAPIAQGRRAEERREEQQRTDNLFLCPGERRI